MDPNELKEARKNLKKTQKEMAELIGITVRGYQYYEKGSRKIPKTTAAFVLIMINEEINEEINEKARRDHEFRVCFPRTEKEAFKASDTEEQILIASLKNYIHWYAHRNSREQLLSKEEQPENLKLAISLLEKLC